MSQIAKTPKPPYYVVCFTTKRSGNSDGYAEMAAQMAELAKEQDGYLGYESVHDASGFGITLSYWRDEEAIRAWRENGRHLVAQKLGRERWYDAFFTRIARVERDSG